MDTTKEVVTPLGSPVTNRYIPHKLLHIPPPLPHIHTVPWATRIRKSSSTNSFKTAICENLVRLAKYKRYYGNARTPTGSTPYTGILPVGVSSLRLSCHVQNRQGGDGTLQLASPPISQIHMQPTFGLSMTLVLPSSIVAHYRGQ